VAFAVGRSPLERFQAHGRRGALHVPSPSSFLDAFVLFFFRVKAVFLFIFFWRRSSRQFVAWTGLCPRSGLLTPSRLFLLRPPGGERYHLDRNFVFPQGFHAALALGRSFSFFLAFDTLASRAGSFRSFSSLSHALRLSRVLDHIFFAARFSRAGSEYGPCGGALLFLCSLALF